MADSKRSTGGNDQPITRHPLFPAIVALWFGALAGLGSVVVSSATIEGIVLALGIDKVIPMAAPPLGTTMRILLALGMTGVGAAIGGLIARRIARPAAISDAQTTEAQAFAPADDAAEAATAAAPRRRRALAIEPEAVPAGTETAPVPGQAESARILNVADFEIDSFDEAPAADAPFRRAAELAPEAAAFDDRDSDDADDDDNLPAWLEAESAWHEPNGAAPQSDRGVFTTPPGAQIFQAELEAAEQAAAQEAQAPVGSRLFEAYSRELSPRTGPAEDGETAQPGFSLLPRLPQADWHASTAADEPAFTPAPAPVATPVVDESVWDDAVPPFETPVVETGFDDAAPAAFVTHVQAATEPAAEPAGYAPFEVRSAAERIVDADLGTLSQVELLERLALAMEQRRETARRAAEDAARAAEQAPPPFAAPVIEDAPQADHGTPETSFAETSFAEPTWPAPVPDALRPVAFDPIDDAAETFSNDLPPRHIGLSPVPDTGPQGDAGFDPHAAIPFPSSPFSAEDEPEEEDPMLQQGYSSLLNLSRQATMRKPFLQFSEPDETGDEIAHATPIDGPADGPFQAPELQAQGDQDGQMPAFGRPVLLPDPVGEAPAELEERPFDAPRNDPEATERALRAALATLQRMSGAA